MALPAHLQHGLSPAEVAFLSESTTIAIQPRQAMSSLQLIDSVISAFKPPQSAQVPLWLGLLLKRQRRARIIPPQWLNHENLQEMLDQEEKEPQFAALPFQWLEISSALLDSASDDIIEPDLTRRLLRDLREVRHAKARKGIETVGDTHLQMDNLGVMEINEIRFLGLASDQLRHLNAAKIDPDAEGVMAANGDTESYGGSTWED